MPISKIRQLAGTDRKGTNILGLIEASEKIGFTAKGVKADWDSLFKIPFPTIAHIVVKGILTHYVVILKITKTVIKIMDPADGAIHRITHEDFKSQWTGVLVLIAPGERFRIKNEKAKLTTRLVQLVKPSRGILMQSLVGALIYSILGLSISLYVGKIVDNVIPGGNANLLNLLGVAMLVIIVFRLLLLNFQSVFILKTGPVSYTHLTLPTKRIV